MSQFQQAIPIRGLPTPEKQIGRRVQLCISDDETTSLDFEGLDIVRRTILSTILAYDKKDANAPFLLGWKEKECNDPYMEKYSASLASLAPHQDPRQIAKCIFVPDLSSYPKMRWIGGGSLVIAEALTTLSLSSGMKCSGRRCGIFVPMADANQPDGTFVCYSCRQLPTCLR